MRDHINLLEPFKMVFRMSMRKNEEGGNEILENRDLKKSFIFEDDYKV